MVLRTFLRKLSRLALGAMTITGIGAIATDAARSQSEAAAAPGKTGAPIACTYHNDRSANVPCSSCGVRG
jgi:hypothetical protein